MQTDISSRYAAPEEERWRAMVVEDNPINQVVMAQMLRKLGAEVTVVTGGRQAVEFWRAERFGMVFMDCQMPEMDGYETTRIIRSLEPELGRSSVPIVAITAFGLSGEREKCLEAGMNDYIAKPVPEDVLRRVVEQWVPARRALSEVTATGVEGMCFPPSGVDRETLLGMEQLLGERCYLLLERYLELTGAAIRQLERAIAAGNSEAALEALHPVKSPSAQVGALRLSALLEVMESTIRADKQESIAVSLSRIGVEFRVVSVLIGHFLKRYEPVRKESNS